jgi:hypothetical protein
MAIVQNLIRTRDPGRSASRAVARKTLDQPQQPRAGVGTRESI